MKIYKTNKSLPIVFEHESFKDSILVDLKYEHSVSWGNWSTLKDIKEDLPYLLNSINDNSTKVTRKYTRMYITLMLRGILCIREKDYSVDYVSIVCKENNKLVAYITSSESIFDVPATIITLSNKFVKAYGVKLKDFQYMEKAEFIKKFCLPFELTLEDYSKEYQKEISSNFLKEEISKLNTVENE